MPECSRKEGAGWTRKWSSLDSDIWHMCFTNLRRRLIQCQSCHLTTHTLAECIWSPFKQSLVQPASEAASHSSTPVRKSWNFSPNQDCAFQTCKFQNICIYCCKDPTLTRQQITHKGMFCRGKAQQDQQHQWIQAILTCSANCKLASDYCLLKLKLKIHF